MDCQITLMTSHKGVDLHAVSARAVLRDRLAGGERLLALNRAEFHTFWSDGGAEDEAVVARLLATGRCFNPNKHHYGSFRLAAAGGPWPERAGGCRGEPLPPAWPGAPVACDAGRADPGLADRLLGGGPATEPGAGPAAAAGAARPAVVDVCAFPLGERGPVLSGVAWRLVVAPGERPGEPAAPELARRLAITRGVREGLLVNPHMEGWLFRAREA
jgi:hypothetical protein